MVQITVTEMDFKRLMLVCLLIVGFSVGTDENKRKVVQAVCGTEGFIDQGLMMTLIYFQNVKVGRLYRFLNSPVEILYMSVTRLVHALAIRQLLAACAHRSECGYSSMRGSNFDWLPEFRNPTDSRSIKPMLVTGI